MRGQLLKNFRGTIGIAQDDSMQIPAERRFQGGNKFGLNVEARDQRARNRGPQPFGIVKSLQDGLRSLLQTVAFLCHLAEDFESGLFLPDRSLHSRDLFFRRCHG